ncbi:hypothetical protein AAVH_26784 [Aphelenchoides avenae]|nr:hypothetical protein AAVH_26784 [Aphelenchus avenae]
MKRHLPRVFSSFRSKRRPDTITGYGPTRVAPMARSDSSTDEEEPAELARSFSMRLPSKSVGSRLSTVNDSPARVSPASPLLIRLTDELDEAVRSLHSAGSSTSSASSSDPASSASTRSDEENAASFALNLNLHDDAREHAARCSAAATTSCFDRRPPLPHPQQLSRASMSSRSCNMVRIRLFTEI